MRRMNGYSRTVMAALVLLGAGAACLPAQAQQAEGRTLKVKLNYSGAGAVDQKHQIFVFVFDSPDFMQRNDVMPIGSGSATGKDGTATVSGLAKSPVYVVAVYDPKGEYDGMSVPPSGCSLGMYGKEPGKPAPVTIEDGKTAAIEIAFDDANKMP